MRVLTDSIVFDINAICPHCNKNQNENGTFSSIQVSLNDIVHEAGWPICQYCDELLNVEEYCEAIV